LEVTESVLLDNNKNTLKVFDELQRLGFKLSLDDFGSGYSTVSTFFNFPFSQIKIDRHLVERSQNNLSCQDFIRFLTKFANSNGIETVAEGIEYLDQIKQLKDLKVTHVQGFALGRPVDTTKWLKFYR
jgi:EAL domain-containing protein (putative c-di-GMP-specific phosphodiesterase class I)